MSVVADIETMIPETREKRYLTRYSNLVSGRISGDFDRARLAREIRNEFEPGNVGDGQMRLWLRKRLGVRTKASVGLLSLAEAIQVFPLRETWNQVGGAPSIVLLMGLTAVQRNKVLSAVRKATAGTGFAPSRGLVANIARKLGFVSRRTEGNPLPTRRSLDTLRDFIRRNLANLGVATEDALPADVRNALG